MKRDHTKLICDIGELSGLFSSSSDLDAFLQRIVEMISAHMYSAVCSIYLYYSETSELVLKATKGLNPEAVGNVRLKLGDGLTGLAVKEMRPICEECASKAPGYHYFPEIGEEIYDSFLAVPILRGQNRIGAIVVQNAQKNYFTEEDINAFRAITSQLANTIEITKVLMGLQDDRSTIDGPVFGDQPGMISAKIGSEGVALAEAVIFFDRDTFLKIDGAVNERSYSLDDFRRAVRDSERQLEDLQKCIEEKLSDVASLIFTAQILMLKDKAFLDDIENMIHEGINPPNAIETVVCKYIKIFEGLGTVYLQEKKEDVKDIGRRLLKNLLGVDENLGDYHKRIVIAQELFPSEILKLSSQDVCGLILLSGGVTSHLAILSRSLGIPLMIADCPDLLKLPARTEIFMDAQDGQIHFLPSAELKDLYRRKKELHKTISELSLDIKAGTITKDGTSVKLLANINLLNDLEAAQTMKADGVGLYRTEFPFMIRSDFPSEEEQFILYKRLIDRMDEKKITFRTLDIGGDKILSYFDYGKEENPFLGMRSIRFSLKYQDVFRQQIRAILRAGLGAQLQIMFPMISSLDEFFQVKEILRQCMEDMREKKILHHDHPKIGLMIELPSVLEMIDEFADEADFFSIGTNDFIQYMLAVDRTNEKVADIYLPHHPAVLRSLNRVVLAAAQRNITVTVCGDMAQDIKYIPFLLGVGIRELSIDAQSRGRIQRFIEELSLDEARTTAEKLLACTTVRQAEQELTSRERSI